MQIKEEALKPKQAAYVHAYVHAYVVQLFFVVLAPPLPLCWSALCRWPASHALLTLPFVTNNFIAAQPRSAGITLLIRIL